MKTQWKKVWVKAVIWLVSEIILNLSGFDNLADYSEFIFDQEITVVTSQPQITAVARFRRTQFDACLPCRYTIAFNA